MGGYVILDLKRILIPNTSDTPVVIEGIYDRVLEILSTNKPTLLINAVLDYSGTATALPTMYVCPTETDEDITIITWINDIHVTFDDEVSYS